MTGTAVFYTTRSFYFFKSPLLLLSNIRSSGQGRRSLQITFKRSSFPVPYLTETDFYKIESIELHLHSLYLHLPKKAIRFELSSIWFQECTYLYLSHVSCTIMDLVDVCMRRGLCSVCSIYPGADILVLILQKPALLHNIKVLLGQYRTIFQEKRGLSLKKTVLFKEIL